jgi:hypothetical protein
VRRKRRIETDEEEYNQTTNNENLCNPKPDDRRRQVVSPR